MGMNVAQLIVDDHLEVLKEQEESRNSQQRIISKEDYPDIQVQEL
jgi:hypothetical protein